MPFRPELWDPRLPDSGTEAHPSHHLEEDGIQSVSFQLQQPLDLAAFRDWLQDMPETLFAPRGCCGLWMSRSGLSFIRWASGKPFSGTGLGSR
jgi:hypothetical protein